MERWTQEWSGATEGRETSLRTSPLSSPLQYTLMETEEKTHSIHSIGDVKVGWGNQLLFLVIVWNLN